MCVCLVKDNMPAGRPKIFDNAEDMKNAIKAYFISCQDPDDENKYIRPLTITGLANSIGMTRESLLNYEKDDEFFLTIKEAKSKVEQFVEEYLFTGRNQTGAIFNLKNNYKGWKEKTEQDITSDGKPIIIDHSLIAKNATDNITKDN